MARILSAFHWLCHLELVAGKCLQHHLSAAFTNILAPFPLVSGCKFQSLFSPHLLLKALRVAGKSHSLQFPLTPRYYSLIFLLTSFGLQSSLYTAYLHTLFSFFLLLPPLSSFSSSSSSFFVFSLSLTLTFSGLLQLLFFSKLSSNYFPFFLLWRRKDLSFFVKSLLTIETFH